VDVWTFADRYVYQDMNRSKSTHICLPYSGLPTGYIGAGPFIGGMVGSIFVGWLSDPVIKRIARRNNGV
jgi:hypothetical protein